MTIVFAPAALAATCTSTATGGNWSLPATWTGCGGATPGAADTAVIATTGANLVTANVAITVGAVTVSSGRLNIANQNWTVSGATTINNGGTLDHTNNGGTATFTGLVTVDPGGTYSNTSGESCIFRGGITNNGTFSGGAGTQTFNLTQAIGGGAAMSFGAIVAVTGAVTITNNNTNVVTITGNLTGSAGGSTWVNAAGSTLNYGGAAAPMGTRVFTVTAAGNTVNYTRAGAQPGKVTTYANLTVSGSGAKTFATTPTVTGVLSMEGTATIVATAGVVTYGANATLQYNTATARTASAEEWITPFAASGGVIIANTGAITMGAAKVFNASVPLTINLGATLTPGANLLTLGGNFSNAGTLTSGSGGVTIANTAATQSIDGFTTTGAVSMTKTSGTATLQGTVNGAGLTINGAGGTLNLGAGLTHTFTGAWTRTAGTLDGGSSTLRIAGSCSGVGGTFTAGTGTVDWNAAGAQTVCPVTYYHLNLSNSGAKTMTGVTTIGGDLSIQNSATMTLNAGFTVTGALNYASSLSTTLTAATAVSVGRYNQTAGTLVDNGNTITVTGTGASTWTNSGTYTATGTVNFTGAAPQIGTANFNNLTITVGNGNTATLTGNVTATTAGAGVVTLTSGSVTTGANTLIVPRSCATPSVVRTGGWVYGNLQKAIPAGVSTCNFEVGDASNYTPVSTTFAATTTAGNLTASTVGSQHPSIGDTSSGLNPGKMVNRYWTLTNGGVGGLGTGYSATFTFINGTPVDLTSGANAGNFEIERWDGAAWSTTTVGAQNPADTTASGLTAFGAFAIGEKKSTVVSINCASACATPTGAATVAWTVTFDKSVTGVDATPFSLVPTGLTGAYITTVSGSGTTWTVTANTGIGSGSLGLNQSGAGTVVPTLVGTFTGQVYTTVSISALAEYRMDDASWTGVASEVADSSGSGNHAQAFNSANTTDGSRALAGSPGTCRYGVFDNGSTITQGYVQTPLPNLTTDFTVTAWVRTTNNAVTGQRILIDDNNNTTGYGFSLGDGAAGRLRFFSRGITPIIFDSTYTLASNTWYFVAAVADIVNQKRTIYVFDSAGALLAADAEGAAWTGTWGSDAGPVSIGAETNASAELPATYHFRGNLDEIRVYQKVLNQTALAAIATQTHACPVHVPDHLVIQSSGSGLTCATSTLTVLACQNPACTIPFIVGVSGTLSATGAPTVNWDGTTGGAAGAGFVIPSDSSSVTKDMQVATAGTVVFGINSPLPVPTNPTTCNFGSPTCTFTASSAGFIFSDTSTPGDIYSVPTQVSGIATPTLYLRAVQASTTNPAVCTPAIISQTIGVNMGYVCNNPVSCQAGNLATINATAVAPGGTSVSLSFDANGSAPITARYDDVGQITLNASKTLTPFGGATPIALTGSSNAYVVKPHHFDLSAIQQTAAPNLANPAAANAAGAKFVKAGEQFSVTVTARNFLNAATPNFGLETSPESVKLTTALVAPSGGVNPALGGSFGAFSGGAATGTTFAWNEVGIVTLTPSIGDGDYLGVGEVSGTATGNVGRFYPDHFETAVTAAPMGCGALAFVPTCPAGSRLAYSGQSFTTEVTAYTLGGTGVAGITSNYSATESFAKAVTLTAWDAIGSTSLQNPPATGGTLTGNSIAAASFAAGVASASPVYTYTASPTAPTNVYFRAIDTDSVSSLNAVPANSVEGGIKVVSGRLQIENMYGPPPSRLATKARALYWGGTQWTLNTSDTVSGAATGNFALGDTGTCVTPTFCGITLSSAAAIGGADGEFRLVLTPPTSGSGRRSVLLSSIVSYLTGSGRQTWGSFRAPYIHQQER